MKYTPSEYADKIFNRIQEKIKENNLSPELIFLSDDKDDRSYIMGLRKDCKKYGIKFRTEPAKIVDVKGTKGILAPTIPYIVSSSYVRDGYVIYNSSIPNANKLNVDVSSEVYDPATPFGIYSFLKENEYDFMGKNVVVIGRSATVGKPLAMRLIDEDCTLTVCNSKSDLDKHLWFADLVIIAIDKIAFFKEKTNGLLLANKDIIDVGMGLDDSGYLCGNVEREFLEKLKEQEGHVVLGGKGTFGKITRAIILNRVVNNYITY